MKMTRFAFGAKCGAFGLRSYARSFAAADSAANSRSCWNMEFAAIAPNPMAASCNARLRVKNLFMGSISSHSYKNPELVTVQEVIGPKHRLDEQAQPFFWIRFRCNRFFRDFLFFLSR